MIEWKTSFLSSPGSLLSPSQREEEKGIRIDQKEKGKGQKTQDIFSKNDEEEER